MLQTKLIPASIMAIIMASAGTALAAQPGHTQPAPSGRRFAMITNSSGAYDAGSADSTARADAPLGGNEVVGSTPKGKPTFRRPGFMTWSWYAKPGPRD